LANLYGGPLDRARADFEKAAALVPKDAYAALLLELADRRGHAASRLPAAAQKLDMTAWPAPIVRLFLGQRSPAATLAAARDPDPAKERARLCEANFYVAEFSLLNGAAAAALPLYRTSARDCPNYVQRGTANAALKALGVLP
jgi:lipoprotein NlpI